MRKLAQLIVVSVFLVGGLIAVACSRGANGTGVLSQAAATATPPANANAAPAAPATGDKKMAKKFVLGQDSLDEKYHEVDFDHETHAFQKYSPDGTTSIGCVECHHTDQPKSALKPPLKTSERDVALTFDTWKASSQKVSTCRSCHFQDGSVPDGKEMPTGTYAEGGSSKVKDLNNQLAYHLNCNSCHDAAAKLRPELRKKPGFATGEPKDCGICHKTN